LASLFPILSETDKVKVGFLAQDGRQTLANDQMIVRQHDPDPLLLILSFRHLISSLPFSSLVSLLVSQQTPRWIACRHHKPNPRSGIPGRKKH
jgi:hypothetical protein